MRVKQFKGKVYGADLTAKERKAMELEINRQIAEADRQHTNDFDAMRSLRHRSAPRTPTTIRRSIRPTTPERKSSPALSSRSAFTRWKMSWPPQKFCWG